MENLRHPLYYNKLWVIISGDKGAQTMKFIVGIGGRDPHLLGMFEASDTPANLMAFQSMYMQQIRDLIQFGLKVTEEDGEKKVIEVEVFAAGDKAYLSDENGHAGGASSFPSIYRLVTSKHLRKQHLDGSPHNKSSPLFHFPERTPEGIDRDYHENVNDTRSGDIRKRGKYHNSIVGPRLLPLKSQEHFCVSSLHIGLAVTLDQIDKMEKDCDLIDGTKNVDDLAELENQFAEMDGLAEDSSDDDEEDISFAFMESEPLSDVINSNKERRSKLEADWQDKSMEVMEMEAREGDISEQIMAKFATLDRIEMVQAGDQLGVEKVAKKESKARHSLKSFGNWKPRSSWKCDHCMLTGYDRNIQWQVCISCSKNIHTFCQVYSDIEILEISSASPGLYQGRSCSGVKTLDEIKSKLKEQVKVLKLKSTDVTIELSKLREEESHLKQDCSKFMRVTRLRFQKVLEKDLSVNRSDYHSSCFVGNHCDIIVDKFEQLIEVFSNHPEVKIKYDIYKPLHFLMKARRFLTLEELDKIDYLCEKIGEVYPKHFRGTITPKFDDLIFEVPRFARRWNTVGGLREEQIEAFHNISK